MIYLPRTDAQALARAEAWRHRAESARAKAASEVAPALGLSADEVAAELERIGWEYSLWCTDSEGTERGAEAKVKLIELAAAAEALESAMLALGPGAFEVMTRPTVRQDLYEEAEPWGLPDKGPDGRPTHLVGASEEENRAMQEEWFRGGRWVIRLHALAELARVKADRIQRQIAKGGRRSFAARLSGGSPDDRLAMKCQAFAKQHGCEDLKVVNRMVVAIREAEQGQDKGKAPKDKRRKAVRKLAQTNRKTGTV